MKNLYKGILSSKYHAKEMHTFSFQEKEYRAEGDDFKDWARYQLPYLSGGIYRFHATVLLGGYFEGEAIHVSAVFRERAEMFSEIFEQSNFRRQLLEDCIENCELGILEYLNSDHLPRFITAEREIQITDKKFIGWLEDKFSPRPSGGYGFKYWVSMKFEELAGEIYKVSLLHINLWNGIRYEP